MFFREIYKLCEVLFKRCSHSVRIYLKFFLHPSFEKYEPILFCPEVKCKLLLTVVAERKRTHRKSLRQIAEQNCRSTSTVTEPRAQAPAPVPLPPARRPGSHRLNLTTNHNTSPSLGKSSFLSLIKYHVFFTLHGNRDRDQHNRKQLVLIPFPVSDQCEHFCII